MAASARESRNLHLRFQNVSGGDTPDRTPTAGGGDCLLQTHTHPNTAISSVCRASAPVAWTQTVMLWAILFFNNLGWQP